ncbi:hypothetical protein [Tuwongella immobilis]|nr:hypothetical protein [Tuwongella immobilis]
MSERSAFLLSPYRLPTHHPIILNDDEMRAWLHGALVLWHPAVLRGGIQPPQVNSPYDHESPQEGQIFALPDAPTLFQPDDWPQRVKIAGALAFTATADRAQTLENLVAGLRSMPNVDEATLKLLDLPMEQLRPFFGLGYGYMVIESLFDAMSHDHLLAVDDFWNDLTQAVEALLQPDSAEQVQMHLRSAAERLQSAREILYPITMHLLDVVRLPEATSDWAWPASLQQGVPLNLLANGQQLQRLEQDHPERLAELKEKLLADVEQPLVDVVGGILCDRPDSLLPLESQLWNLREGKALSESILGRPISIFARQSSAYHPQLPQFLQAEGIRHGLMLTFDNAVMPNYRATVVNWSAPDGRTIDAFTRMPLPAHDAQTFFNLVYTLQQSISQDTAPTVALMHEGKPAVECYEDWLALSQLAPALGTWTTFGRYFNEALAGEYVGAATADEFFADDLDTRSSNNQPDCVSGFVQHAQLRRKLDSAFTLATIYRTLQGGPPSAAEQAILDELATLEASLERRGPQLPPPNVDGSRGDDPLAESLATVLQQSAEQVAARLQVRATDQRPGLMLLNPCSFTRRIVLERDDIRGPIPVDGPIKAAQFDAGIARLVVEIPPLGFAWIPREAPGTAAPKPRLKMADGTTVRNEFFEAELDPQTGALRAFRDSRTRTNRLGQQLLYQPGSKMVASRVEATISGAALGEVISEGELQTEHGETLAKFRQRIRAWLGRPVLELKIDLEPVNPPEGYPWHAYFGARFAWRDERSGLFRGHNGYSTMTQTMRPVTPDFLDVRLGRSSSAILTGGLPFHQKHGTRMLDSILIPQGEIERSFEFGLVLDREQLAPAAQGWITPVIAVPTEKGPPHIGPTGWLFHLDAPNLLLTSMRPNLSVGGSPRSMIARFIETSGFSGLAEWTCFRNPARVQRIDPLNGGVLDLSLTDDRVPLEFAASEMLTVQIDLE